jgi:glycosyltransferase involved in cell wall biosynthesis
MYNAALSKNSQVIFQNTDDRNYFSKNNIVPSTRTNIIKTSGVNIEEFAPSKNYNLTNKTITFTLIARMLWDKGIREFIEAAEYVKQKNPSTHFVLLGGSDNGNPKAVPESYLLAKKLSGIIDWIDHVDNVRPYIDDSDVVVLPSYREGGPRSLIEGASMGKPLIATHVPGCREIVEHEVNGLLVPSRDVISLADAMLALSEDHELRYQMGRNGRKKVLEEFDEKIVIRKTLDVYKKAESNTSH